jgi:hypothetical protein
MVTNLVDMGAFSDVPPVESTVSGHVETLLGVVVSQSLTDVSCSKNESNGILRGVDWSELSHMGIDLEMQGAAVFDEASSGLSVLSGLRGLKKLPLATLVVSDVGLHVLLHLAGSYRFFNLEHIFMGLLLLLVSVVVVSHS